MKCYTLNGHTVLNCILLSVFLLQVTLGETDDLFENSRPRRSQPTSQVVWRTRHLDIILDHETSTESLVNRGRRQAPEDGENLEVDDGAEDSGVVFPDDLGLGEAETPQDIDADADLNEYREEEFGPSLDLQYLMYDYQDLQENDTNSSGLEEENFGETLEETEDWEEVCQNGEAFGCCSSSPEYPAHGDSDLGCCASSEFGCCPDHTTPASGPYFQGCDCRDWIHGCCPDELTPARGPDLQGCGCRFTEFGCCPDHKTQASGPDYEGCSCETFRHGCCPDGQTRAQGPNLEGCNPPCAKHPGGCCPDELTPVPEDGQCGCEASKYGCCLDGSFATGQYFMGCLTIPGENCFQKEETGSCTDYSVKWFYDKEFGGCNRFWYGGCDKGNNHFDTQEECDEECSQPRGSGVCFLKKVVGPCKGNYTNWYYDSRSRMCRAFPYGGCLGNGNRFDTKAECEGMCKPLPETPICQKPKAEGACKGDFKRWFFDASSGTCKEFSYSGCMGNNNRFMTEEDCSSTCRHEALERNSELICSEPIESGSCDDVDGASNQTKPVWGYNSILRRCVPFYWTGCGGSRNRFTSLEMCETVCPTTFAPVINLDQGSTLLLERGTQNAKIGVSIKANPPANVSWRHNSVFAASDPNLEVLEDFSLIINEVNDFSGGNYTVMAENKIGEPVEATVKVVVYPIYPTVALYLDKNIQRPGTDVKLTCKMTGYPLPEVVWFKKRFREREEKLSENSRIQMEMLIDEEMKQTAILYLRSISDEDTATYICQAETENFPPVRKSTNLSVQYGPQDQCVDRPTFSRFCKHVVKNRQCESKYYGKFCCRSCSEAGFIPGGQLNS